MKKFLQIAMLGGALMVPAVAQADATKDAAVFISHAMPDAVFDIQFEGMRPLLHDTVIGMMARSSIEPNDEVAEIVVDIYLQEYQREAAARTRKQMIDVYTSLFTEDELEELREFAESRLGKRYFGSQAILSRMGNAVGMQIGMEVSRSANNEFHDRLRAGELDQILSPTEKQALLSFWF